MSCPRAVTNCKTTKWTRAAAEPDCAKPSLSFDKSNICQLSSHTRTWLCNIRVGLGLVDFRGVSLCSWVQFIVKYARRQYTICRVILQNLRKCYMKHYAANKYNQSHMFVLMTWMCFVVWSVFVRGRRSGLVFYRCFTWRHRSSTRSSLWSLLDVWLVERAGRFRQWRFTITYIVFSLMDRLRYI